MKNIYFLTGFFLLSITAFAQTDGISYQAVILNPSAQELPGVNAVGNIFPNKTISIRFTITNENDTNDYQETQTTTTDSYGMINLFIGEGNQISTNSFNEIDWDGTPKDLKVDIDFEGGNNFETLGAQKLTFVPYAFHRNITATGNLTVDGVSTFNNDLVIEGDLTVQGITNLNNELNVAGITTINNDLTINANTTLNGTTNITGQTTLEDNVIVNGTSTLNDDLTVNANTTFNGTINTTGETTLENNLNVEGNTILANLIVRGGNDIGGGAGTNHIALFENTNPSNSNDADGIAIRIQGNASNKLGFRNRFVTFYGNGDYVAGRIESYDLLAGDFFESFPIPDFANLFNIFDFTQVLEWTPPSLAFNPGSLPSLTGGALPSANFNRGSLPSWHSNGTHQELHRGSLPSLNFNRGSFPTLNTGSLPTSSFDFGTLNLNFDGFFDPQAGTGASDDIEAMVGWGMRNGDPGFLPTSPWQLAAATLILAAKQVARDQGVIYGSKGADYAEWLEKENIEDTFMFGEVVGVKGGKISRNTTDADQVMSISLAPIVLGNMPNEDVKENFEKVGFMGQVPILTLGDVEVGDYIVASGYNDGYAKAISSEDIKLKDLKTIIGKAWTGSEGQKASLINVSVGLKTNEWVSIFKQQEARINILESKLNNLENLSERFEKLESKLEILRIN